MLGIYIYVYIIKVRGDQKWTIQRNWQHMVQKTKTNKTKTQHICVGHHYAQTNTNNVNKTQDLQTTVAEVGTLPIHLL
jgi:hypothetical protein